jgi:phage baseplate assembly protein W
MNKEVAISLPFSIDSYGKISQTTDQAKIWSDRVRSVIGTGLRERVMRPILGTSIPSAVFDSQSNATDLIKQEVANSFAQQLGLLTLSEVNTSFDEYTGVMNVSITYDLPNAETAIVNIGLATIVGNLPINQEPL